MWTIVKSNLTKSFTLKISLKYGARKDGYFQTLSGEFKEDEKLNILNFLFACVNFLIFLELPFRSVHPLIKFESAKNK